jgi:hypothetical protein
MKLSEQQRLFRGPNLIRIKRFAMKERIVKARPDLAIAESCSKRSVYC